MKYKGELILYLHDGEIHDTKYANQKHPHYWAARLLILGNYKSATRAYANDSGDYFVDVREDGYGSVHEKICYNEQNEDGIRQAIFLEEYIRNESYYKDYLWASASMNVVPPAELTPDKIIEWKRRILIECFKQLTQTVKSDVDIFNELCMELVCAVYGGGRDEITDMWNPHDDMQQLIFVFNHAVNRGAADFIAFGDVQAGQTVDIVEEMRMYITKYGDWIIERLKDNG